MDFDEREKRRPKTSIYKKLLFVPYKILVNILWGTKIFEKYGLFCTGCEPGMGENVEEGCRLHGLSVQKTRELISELSSLEFKN